MAELCFSTLISTTALCKLITQHIPFRLLDSTYSSDSFTNYLAGHIPGATYFDFSKLSTNNPLHPHIIPSESTFATYMKELELPNDNTPTIIYNKFGSQSAARLWFLLKLYGKQNIAVLDGGFEKWVNETGDIEKGEVLLEKKKNPESEYEFKSKGLVKDYNYVSLISELLSRSPPQSLSRIVDARSPKRFLGLSQEPGGGKSGNIPGSNSLHFSLCLNKDFTYKSKDELLEVFNGLGFSLDQSANVIHVSGKGISACSNILAFELAGYQKNFLYEGTWAEWAEKFVFPEVSNSPKVIMEKAYFSHLKKKNLIK